MLLTGLCSLPTQNVVELAVSYNPDEFTQLVAALTRTTVDDGGLNLIDFLSGDGPFTVFAPTDAAFQALLDSNTDWNSVDDIPIATLRDVLTYHVGGFAAFSTDLATGPVQTFGGTFNLDLTAGTITTSSSGTANLTETLNVLGTNGVIHVIDAVLVP
jgi:transforming growth factor-beta-induced protein